MWLWIFYHNEEKDTAENKLNPLSLFPSPANSAV